MAMTGPLGTLPPAMPTPSGPIIEPPAPSPLQAPAVAHNVGGWIAHWARLQPTHPAWTDDASRHTYAEAEDRVQRVTGWLARNGLESKDRLALWLGNRIPFFEAFFACARLGAITLPVNARLTPSEVAFQLDDCRPRLILVEPRWRSAAEKALALTRKCPNTRIIVIDDDHDEAIRAQSRSATIRPVSPETPMILMYTSGTTGHPKGALLPHRKALFNSLNAQLYFDLRREDRALVVAPLFHSLALQILSLPALYCGASIRLQEGFDPGRVWKTIEAEGITFAGGVPTMHERLLASLDAGEPFDRPPGSLRFLFTAGAAAPSHLAERFERHGVLMLQGYGQTETSTLTCQTPDQALAKPSSVGRPVAHAEIRLVDPMTFDAAPEAWRDVSPGEVGEVVARGPITMLGYWERPEATQETLREGWVRTGDLATRDEDFDLTLVGRAREMYISGGENVYPAEIEAALLRHPAIAEAAVVARPDTEWGEVGLAYVVAAEGEKPGERELLDWLSERIARFKQPREIRFESSLPRTASGKIQKNRLAQ